MSKNTQLNVLIAPLDWGLGHTTRCIPIIKALQKRGCNVFIACNNWQKKFLQNEITAVTFLDLEGYNIHYSKKFLFYTIGAQALKIKRSIKKEHLWTSNIIREYNIDWIISYSNLQYNYNAPTAISFA